MKTVVTGAAGFIGANLVRALLHEGREVRAVDNVSRGSEKNLNGLDLEVVHADLRDWNRTKMAIEGADVLYHLAAKVGSIDYLHGSNLAEFDALQSNLAIDTNVFRAAKEFGISKIVYASSVSVYPIKEQTKLNARFREEDTEPIDPEGGYGWAKLVGEIQLAMMGSRAAAARIFNAYGEFSEYGETAQVVPALIRKAINYPREEFVVWGDGSQTRNLVYIGDVVEALIRMESKASNPPLILNIGNERTVPVRELANVVVKTSKKEIYGRFDTSKPVGPLSRIPDITKAKETIGWFPRVSLEDGIRLTYEWMANEMDVVSDLRAV